MMLKILKRVPAFLFAMLLLCNVYAGAIDVYDSNSDVVSNQKTFVLSTSKYQHDVSSPFVELAIVGKERSS